MKLLGEMNRNLVTNLKQELSVAAMFANESE
jgi:hypothetical protein